MKYEIHYWEIIYSVLKVYNLTDICINILYFRQHEGYEKLMSGMF